MADRIKPDPGKAGSKVTKIIITIVLTALAVAGLFLLRSYLLSKGIEILADVSAQERVLKFKRVSKGHFAQDTLTGVVRSGDKIVLSSQRERGTIEGRADLSQLSLLTKVKIGVRRPYPNASRINLEVNVSRDGKTWSPTYSSNRTDTVELASRLGTRKYKYIKYKITLIADNSNQSPQLLNLGVWGRVTAVATVTPSAIVTATGSVGAPPVPPGPGESGTPPVPPEPGDSGTPPVPPGPGDSGTPIIPELTSTPTVSPTESLEPEETPTATGTQVTTANIFASPDGNLLVSGIKSGPSFIVLIVLVATIGGFIVYRIAKS
ncbi:MAG: hypothetical protein OEV37_00935 [Candidatus Berkelbacteria bacterium]|nr:hypothetical protein [Candidatus Berkelbacteria bacterium]